MFCHKEIMLLHSLITRFTRSTFQKEPWCLVYFVLVGEGANFHIGKHLSEVPTPPPSPPCKHNSVITSAQDALWQNNVRDFSHGSVFIPLFPLPPVTPHHVENWKDYSFENLNIVFLAGGKKTILYGLWAFKKRKATPPPKCNKSVIKSSKKQYYVI